MATNRPLSSTDYQNSIDYLYQRINYEKSGHANYNAANYRLARMHRLLHLAGNPQLKFRIVHVAGTKGKGSTATFVAELLRAGGLRTGLYTSPHLLRLEERIRVDGVSCSAAELVELVDRLRPAVDQLEREGAGRATFFELTTAMGLLYFDRRNVEAAVLEVGMGGRLDSTNVCQPAISVITSIGLDHQAQLGNTIEQIAGEKAGIIKPKACVVCSARHPDARRAIERRADELDSPIRMIGKDFDASWDVLPRPLERSGVARIHFEPKYCHSPLGRSTWDIAMLGRHQSDNAAAALATIDWLLARNWTLQTHNFHSALAATRVQARIEIVACNPIQIIDTAHNPDSITATLDALDQHFPNHRKTIVFASSKDKDYRQMLAALLHRTDALFLTQYHTNPRSLPLDDLIAAMPKSIPACSNSPDSSRPALIASFSRPKEAWQTAIAKSAPDDIICATGSFFLAAELMDWLQIS